MVGLTLTSTHRTITGLEPVIHAETKLDGVHTPSSLSLRSYEPS
jgi:hypothetical protein